MDVILFFFPHWIVPTYPNLECFQSLLNAKEIRINKRLVHRLSVTPRSQAKDKRQAFNYMIGVPVQCCSKLVWHIWPWARGCEHSTSKFCTCYCLHATKSVPRYQTTLQSNASNIPQNGLTTAWSVQSPMLSLAP